MDRKTICEAQAAICTEQAGRGDSDRAFWLAEARRWHDLAGEHAHTIMSFDNTGRVAPGRHREVSAKDVDPSRRN